MTATPALTGVHHLKFPVTDLQRSRSWYESVLGLRVEREFHDDDGGVGGLAGTITAPDGSTVLTLALRHNPEAARGVSGFDLVALAVGEHASLRAWAEHVTALGYPAPTASADGTVLFLRDPDGIEIRLFSPEH